MIDFLPHQVSCEDLEDVAYNPPACLLALISLLYILQIEMSLFESSQLSWLINCICIKVFWMF